MKAEIVTRISKKTNKEFQALLITIGDYKRLIFLDKYELLYVQNQIENVEKMLLTTDKDGVDASLFE